MARTPLNPYAEKGPLLRIESDNYALKDGKPTKTIVPLYGYAISAKRYALFNLDADGRPIIRKALAHGLGHLLRPVEKPKPVLGIPEPVLDLGKIGVTRWQYDFWYRILEAALSGEPDDVRCSDLPGFNRPAASRYGSPHRATCDADAGPFQIGAWIRHGHFSQRIRLALCRAERCIVSSRNCKCATNIGA